MKFSLSVNQPREYLKKADEIRVLYKDRKCIPDYAEEYPDKTILLVILPGQEYSFDEIKEYNILTKKQLLCCIPDLNPETIRFFHEEKIPFYWGYAVTTPRDLNAIARLGPSYVKVDAPLFFDAELLQRVGIPVRAVPNVAHYAYLPYTDGVNGIWIRPEDVELYEGIVGAMDFEDCDLKKEQALFRIYAEQHKWPGELDMLISNLGASPTNRMIPPDCAIARLTCRQRCESGSACRLCWRYFSLANPDKLRYLLEKDKSAEPAPETED